MDLTPVPRSEAPSDIDYDGQDNPRSIINLVSPRVKSHILAIPDMYLGKTADELEDLNGQPWSVIDQRIRSAFWIEYAEAQDQKRGMKMTNVYVGQCPQTYFYNRILPNKVKMAYILLPPARYRLVMQDALTYGVQKVREILEMPVYARNSDGDIDKSKPLPKVAAVILQAVRYLDEKVHGATVQRLESKNLNVNVEAKNAFPETVAEIDQKLRELEAKAQAVGATAVQVIQSTLPDPDDEEALP